MNEIIVSNNKMPVVCESNHFKTSKDFLHPSRCLPFHVLLYVKKGTFYLTEEDSDYVIPEGSIFFMKAGLHHFGKQYIDAGSEWHFIHFYMDQKVDNLKEYRDMVQPLCDCEKQESFMELPKQLFDMQDSEIVAKLEDVTELAQSSHPYKGWILNQKTAEILNEIAIWNRQEQREMSLSDRVAQYLVKHIDSSFSAEDISKEFYLSYKHLAATFKKEKGISMQQYHNRIRMQRAADILSSTGTGVSEVSKKLGFKDPLYFSRLFRQYFGVSPSQYRRE